MSAFTMRKTLTLVADRFIAARGCDVMQLVADPWTWAQWVPEIVTIEAVDQGPGGNDIIGRAQMLGFDVDGRARILHSDPRALTSEVIVGVRITAHYRLEDAPGGCRVIHRFEIAAPGGLLGTVLATTLRLRLRKTQQSLLGNLAHQVSVGDERHRSMKPQPGVA